MLEIIRKKIITFASAATNFFKDNLAQLVLLLILFQSLLILQDLPFINLIDNFEYYSLAFLLFLAMIFFRIAIPNRKVVYVVLIIFALAIFTTILDLKDVNTIFGFVLFTLLLFIVFRELVRNRQELKGEIRD